MDLFEKTGINWDKVPTEPAKVSEAKIEEMRTLINSKMEKWANTIQVSMTPRESTVVRAEGEQWTDMFGKKWIKKNGISQTTNHMESAVMPWWCPTCSKSMSHRFDRKFYSIRGWCYNCNIEFEGKLRLDGRYPEYERCILTTNEKSILRDKIEEHLTYIREFKVPTVYFEEGGYEVIADKQQFEPLFEQLLNDVDLMVKRLEILDEESNIGYEKVSQWMQEFRDEMKAQRENK